MVNPKPPLSFLCQKHWDMMGPIFHIYYCVCNWCVCNVYSYLRVKPISKEVFLFLFPFNYYWNINYIYDSTITKATSCEYQRLYKRCTSYQSWESPMLNILLKKIDRLLYTAVLSCRLSIQIFDKMQKASDLGQLGYF